MKKLVLLLLALPVLFCMGCSDAENENMIQTRISFVNEDSLGVVQNIAYRLGSKGNYQPLFVSNAAIESNDSLQTTLKTSEYTELDLRYEILTDSSQTIINEHSLPLYIENGNLRLAAKLNFISPNEVHHFFTYAYWTNAWDGE